MELDPRYVVIKMSDLEAALEAKRITRTDVADLKELVERLKTQRFVSDKSELTTVVVESDWPMYNKTVESIIEWSESQQGTYTVKKGEWLGTIAEKLTGNLALWNELIQANPQLASPHLITEGDVLKLPDSWIQAK